MGLLEDCQTAYNTAQTEDNEDWGLLQTQLDSNMDEFDAEVLRQAGLGLPAAVIANAIPAAIEKQNKGPGKKFQKKKEKELFRKFEKTALQYLQTHFEAAGLNCYIERGKKLTVTGWNG